MPSPPPAATEDPEADLRTQALAKLRLGSNPFQSQVATVGTAEESLLASVPEFAAGPFADILDIIRTYREGSPATRVFPVLGDRGAGKTHLLYRLKQELKEQTIRAGDETMLVVVESLSPGIDPIDYLLWQIVNHLLAQGGDNERMLDVIAGRLTGRLLTEALRRLAPHQRVGLFPVQGLWDRMQSRLGSQSRVEKKLVAIESIIQVCSRKNPTPQEIRDACRSSSLPCEVAFELVEKYLQNTESKDILGWFRKALFGLLARLAILGEREPFEAFHDGDYSDAPANVKHAGNLNRRLLDAWLALLKALNIPVVLMFDQLEDYLRSAKREEELINRRFFTSAAALFVNELRNVCILIFAESGFWTDLLNNSEQFASERLRQPFALPGRPAERYIEMPYRISSGILNEIIDRRVRISFPSLDLTGLSSGFPFGMSELQSLNQESSVRACLRKLAKLYDEIVFPSKIEPDDFKADLAKVWKEQFLAQQRIHGQEPKLKVAFLPEVQNALHAWLDVLNNQDMTGSGPWKKLELVSYPDKQPYGTMSVIRTSAPNVPGIGIAVWLGTGTGQPTDLERRLSFFDENPCKIKTLVLLRAGATANLGGKSRTIFDQATGNGRDIRLHKYEPKHMHALLAFGGWQQAVNAKLDVLKESSPTAVADFREFLSQLSSEMLGWIDAWRKPVVAGKGVFS